MSTTFIHGFNASNASDAICLANYKAKKEGLEIVSLHVDNVVLNDRVFFHGLYVVFKKIGY